MTFHIDGVYVRVHPTKRVTSDRWVGYAKTEPFVLRDDPAAPHILEPGELWFSFGNDQAALVDGLVAEVKEARA